MNTEVSNTEVTNTDAVNIAARDKHSADIAEKNITENNLIHFETEAQPQASDINSKISTMEVELGQLNEALGSINASVEEGLDRLGDNDTDLTAKVSETYKRLGEIDNAYKTLMAVSMNLDAEILKITQNVSDVAEQSVSGLKNLEETSVEKNKALIEKNQHVANRVNALVETSRTTTDRLKESVRSNADNILSVEKKLVEEINSLASSTQKNSDNVDRALSSNKARVLKLQQVDEAIIRRATTLEITTGELESKSGEISASIQQLEDKSADLSEKVVDLMVHTQQLQDQADKHTGLINGLQTNLSDMTQSLFALTHLERKHFKVMSVVFLFVLLAIAGLYYYQDSVLQKNTMLYAQGEKNLNQKITDVHEQLNRQVQTQSSAISDTAGQLDSHIVMLGDNLKANLKDLSQQVKQNVNKLNRKIAGMDDKVQSLDGRVNNSLMIEAIGSDNVIHGKQWLADQPVNNYVIRLATVTDKNSLYKIAQDYNYYLKDTLFYYSSVNNQHKTYTLLYGSYVNKNQALQALDTMPSYIDSHRPDIGQFKELGNL